MRSRAFSTGILASTTRTAAGLATTQILAPRFGRLLTWTLSAAGLNDFLQAGFVALTRKANELGRRTG